MFCPKVVIKMFTIVIVLSPIFIYDLNMVKAQNRIKIGKTQ